MHSLSITLSTGLSVIVLCCAFALPSTYAQTPTTTPTPSEEELRLQEQKRLLELQKDIELAKKAIRDAQPQPPTPTATPLAGDTTLDPNVKLEVEMVAYLAMSDIASRIAAEVKGQSSGKNLAIYDAQVVKDWRFYRALLPAFKVQVDDLIKNYQTLLCKNPAEFSTPGFKDMCPKPTQDSMNADAMPFSILPKAFSAGTDILKSFIDLTALFRTDTKIEGKSVTIDESAMVAEVFRALKKTTGGPVKLYYPEVFPPRLTENSPTVTRIGLLFLYKIEADERIKKKGDDKDHLIEALKKPSADKKGLAEQLDPLTSLKERLDNLTAAYEIQTDQAVKKKLKAQMDKLKVEVSELLPMGKTLEGLISELESGIKSIDETEIKPRKKQIDELDEDIKKLSDLNARFLKFVDEFVKVDDKGSNALALFIKSEDVDEAMKDGHWLEIKTVSAGGNNRVRKNLLRYLTGAKLDHSGGLIVEWTLFDKTGAVIASDKVSFYGGYMEPKKIRDKKLTDAVN
jgi:hypothetical protein